MEKMPVLHGRHLKRKYWDDLYQKRLQRFDELKKKLGGPSFWGIV